MMLMTVEEKRRSARIVPIGSNEDVVVLKIGCEQHLAKILDLSDGGTCVYTVGPDAPLDVGDSFKMALYQQSVEGTTPQFFDREMLVGAYSSPGTGAYRRGF